MVRLVPRAINPFLPNVGGIKLAGGIRIPKVAFSAKVENFFDREKVIKAIDKMNYRALMKGSARVKDYARKSIKKMGMAKPKLKVMKRFPNVPISVLIDRNKRRTFRKRGGSVSSIETITARERASLRDRAREIASRPASAPGTPPHTHVPYGHMLGFRRNLWNFFDPGSKSAVAGPSHKGRRLPYLHEFGGIVYMNYYVFRQQRENQSGRMRTPIFMKLPDGQEPANRARWSKASSREHAVYPKRPFMNPAMRKAIAKGDIKNAFIGQFRS